MKGHCKGVQQLPHWVYPVGVQEVMSFLMICYPAEHMCSQRVGWVVLSCILLSPKVTCWCSRCNKECCVFMNLFIPLYHVYIWYIYNHLNCEPSHVKEPIFPKSKKNLSEVLLKTPWPHLSHWCSGTALPYYQRPAHLSTEGRALVHLSRNRETAHHPVALGCLATRVSVGSQNKNHFPISALLFLSLLRNPDTRSLSSLMLTLEFWIDQLTKRKSFRSSRETQEPYWPVAVTSKPGSFTYKDQNQRFHTC